LAQSWLDAGGTVVSGLQMLLHQAVAQVRIFVTGDERGALEREDDVVAAMRSAVGL
jgi:shikimate dehydrogenase